MQRPICLCAFSSSSHTWWVLENSRPEVNQQLTGAQLPGLNEHRPSSKNAQIHAQTGSTIALCSSHIRATKKIDQSRPSSLENKKLTLAWIFFRRFLPSLRTPSQKSKNTQYMPSCITSALVSQFQLLIDAAAIWIHGQRPIYLNCWVQSHPKSIYRILFWKLHWPTLENSLDVKGESHHGVER